jgi:hypothetical protein
MTRHPWDPVQLKLVQKDVPAYQQLGEVVYEKADSARPSSRKMIILRKGKAIVEPDGIFAGKHSQIMLPKCIYEVVDTSMVSFHVV